MSVNRFFQPGRSQRISQFVPNQLPADFLMKMAAAKQGRQDQARNMMIQQQLGFDDTAVFNPDKEYVKGKKAELDAFIQDKYNTDLTQPGQQAEILRYMSGLKADKGLASVAKRNADYKRINDRIRELQNENKFHQAFALKSQLEFNDYNRSSQFEVDRDFSKLSVQENMDRRKAKEPIFDNVPKLKNDQIAPINDILVGLYKQNPNPSASEILGAIESTGVNSKQIVDAAKNGLQEYMLSPAGQNEREIYDAMTMTGALNPNEVSFEDYVYDSLLKTGLERVGVSTTLKAGLSDLNNLTIKGIDDASSVIESPGSTSILGGLGHYATSVEDLTDKIDSYKKAGSMDSASVMQDNLNRLSEAYMENGGGQQLLNAANKKLEKDITSSKEKLTFGNEKASILEKKHFKDFLLAGFAAGTFDGKGEKFRDKIADELVPIMKDLTMSANHPKINDALIYERIQDEDVKKFYKDKMYGETVAGERNLFTFLGWDDSKTLAGVLNSLKDEYYEDYKDGLNKYGANFTVQDRTFRPNPIEDGQKTVNAFDKAFNTAPESEFTLLNRIKDSKGRDMSFADFKGKLKDFKIVLNKGTSSQQIEANYVNSKGNTQTVRLSTKNTGPGSAVYEAAKSLGGDFLKSWKDEELTRKTKTRDTYQRIPERMENMGIRKFNANSSKHVLGLQNNDGNYEDVHFNELAAIFKGNTGYLSPDIQSNLTRNLTSIGRNNQMSSKDTQSLINWYSDLNNLNVSNGQYIYKDFDEMFEKYPDLENEVKALVEGEYQAEEVEIFNLSRIFDMYQQNNKK